MAKYIDSYQQNIDEVSQSKGYLQKPWVKKVRIRRQKARNYQARLKQMNKDLTAYPSPVWERERDGKRWLVRNYVSKRANSAASYCKKSTNRRLRRNDKNLYQNSEFKKVCELWWDIY